MPQISQILDTYASQLFWLLIVFGLVYFTIGRGMLPKVEATMDARDRKIADDLAAAEIARAEADKLGDSGTADLMAARNDALFQSTDRDTTPFARLMVGIEQSYAKRILTVVEYLDFYESYKNNLVQLNSLRAGRVRAFEQLNYTVGKPLFRAD